MRRTIAVLITLLLVFYGSMRAQQSAASAVTRPAPVYIAVPATTSLNFLFVRAVFAKTAKAGDAVYMQTTYPVTAGEQVVIPAGSFLQGQIITIVKPTRKNSHALITVAFQKLIFPNGYAVVLTETQTLNVQVSSASDLFLDNGTHGEIALVQPIQLNARHVAFSLALAHPPAPGSMRSATSCVPTEGTPGSPGTPGTPDTVIPGNPGTPDTVIPGANGAPDTVIPGIPASAPTVIPGTPGTPGDPGTAGTVCPDPPLIVGSTAVVAAPNVSASTTGSH